MNTNGLKVGDLVWVGRPTRCCGKLVPAHGEFYTIAYFKEVDALCSLCGFDLGVVTVAGFGGSSDDGATVCILRKVPPIDESETRETDREVTA